MAAVISHFHLGLLTEQERDSFTLPAGNQEHKKKRTTEVTEINLIKGSKNFQQHLRCSFHRRGKVESRVKRTSKEDEEQVFLLFLCLFSV